MSMNNVCPDYKCDINCKVSLGYLSREHCSTCECYLGCFDCQIRHCPHDHSYNQYKFINFNGIIEPEQD